MKDKKACIFYFFMTIILLNFGNQLRKISYNPLFEKTDNSFFSIIHLNNTGAAFSLFQNNFKVLAALGIVIILLISIYIFKKITFQDKTELLSLTLFSAGALGNSIERFQNGFVVDYIKLNFINFPVFNAFDIMICFGVFLYCFVAFFDFKKKEEENAN